RMELPQLHRTAPRGPRGRALESAASLGAAARELRGSAARRPAGAGGGGQRLRENLRRPDSSLHAQGQTVSGARHRRLWPFGYPPATAPLLRGGSLLGDGGGAEDPGG